MPNLNRQNQNTVCGCEEPGPFNCGLLGILAGLPQKKGHRYIERCDMCERYYSDESACRVYAGIMDGRCSHDRQGKVIWIPR